MVDVQRREILRKAIVQMCGNCNVQGEGKGWPCGTCFVDMLSAIGLDNKDKQYKERNKKHDRHNEVWRAILQIRDAK